MGAGRQHLQAFQALGLFQELVEGGCGTGIAQLHLRLRPSNGDGSAQFGLVLRHERQGLAEQRHGLTLRPSLGSVLGGELEKLNGLVEVAGLLPVVGQQGGGLLDALASRRLRTGYRGVALPAKPPGAWRMPPPG